MNRPRDIVLRRYLLELVRQQRALEQLYHLSHCDDELRVLRSQWRAAYHDIRRDMLHGNTGESAVSIGSSTFPVKRMYLDSQS